MQTRYIAENPDRYWEMSPSLGRHPSVAAVDRWFIASGVVHALVSRWLPAEYARPWQVGTVAVRVILTTHNHSIGIRFSSPL